MRIMWLGSKRGFTLLEIIITLTVTAILATMIFTYFGRAFTESVTPLRRLKGTLELQRIMANITADYNVYPKWRSGASYPSGSYVVPTYFNGRYYRCTTAGTSGASEPNWPLSSGGTVVDNTVTWTESGRVRAVLPLTTLQSRIGAEGSYQTTNEYGRNPDGTYSKYTVVRNRFTQFVQGVDSDGDTSGANKILKVTLKHDSGETITALFFSD